MSILTNAGLPMLLDVLGCQTALFEWAESYDTKDWDRLAKCVAPTVRVSLVKFSSSFYDACTDHAMHDRLITALS